MPSQDQASSLGPLPAAIVIGGLFAGSLDIFVASAINHASNASFRTIASRRTASVAASSLMWSGIDIPRARIDVQTPP